MQRSENPADVKRIAENFDPDMFGIIHVSVRANGVLSLIDGQCRTKAAARALGEDQMVEAKAYEGLTVAEEARLFVHLNDFRLVRRVEKFLRSVTGGEAKFVEINTIVNQAGLRVDKHSGDGIVTAVGSLERVYAGFSGTKGLVHRPSEERANPDLLRKVLAVLTGAWPEDNAGVQGHVIEGLGRFLAARNGVVNTAELVKKLAGYPGGPIRLRAAACGRRQTIGGRVSTNMAAILVEVYNKGRRTGKIEPLS